MSEVHITSFLGGLMLDRHVPYSTQTSALMHMHERNAETWYGWRYKDVELNVLWPMISELCYLIPRMIPRDVFFCVGIARGYRTLQLGEHEQRLLPNMCCSTRTVMKRELPHAWQDIARALAVGVHSRVMCVAARCETVVFVMRNLVQHSSTKDTLALMLKGNIMRFDG